MKDGKKAYLSLLLLADEQEDMIDRYLARGDMFVLDEDGKTLIEYIADRYRERYSILQVGTGDSPLTILFRSAALSAIMP